ncbi:hypothetical protein C8R43DRAFT_1118455 [Mycena crocata]|nr:hypothetical protein C8R43DRAFT_1118455 [Mycena crocata]
MLQLPDDLLRRILEEFIEGYKQFWLSFIFERLRVRAVCRAWRDCVDTSFRFWDVVYIHLFTRPEFVAFCLKKINSTRVSVHICLETMLPDLPLPDDIDQPKSAPVQQVIAKTLPLLQLQWPAVAVVTLSADEEVELAHAMGILTSFAGGKVEKLVAAATWNFGVGHAESWCIDEVPTLAQLSLAKALPHGAEEKVYVRLSALRLGCSWESAQLDGPALLDALSSAATLRTLHLENVEIVGKHTNRVVTLAHLKHLRVDYTTDSCLEVISHLAVYPLATLCLCLGFAVRADEVLFRARDILPGVEGLQVIGTAVPMRDLGPVLAKMTRLSWIEIKGLAGPSGTADWLQQLLLYSRSTCLDVAAAGWQRRGTIGAPRLRHWMWDGGILRVVRNARRRSPEWTRGWNAASQGTVLGELDTDLSWTRNA